MMNEKINFLKTGFPKLLSGLKPDTKGAWGVMNAQEMVEHMTDAFRWAKGDDKLALRTPETQLKGFQDFMRSDREFKPNTKNALMAETPVPVRNTDFGEALKELNKTIEQFFSHFAKNPSAAYMNPFFGMLNFEDQVHLLYKHARHHCKQFGLIA